MDALKPQHLSANGSQGRDQTATGAQTQRLASSSHQNHTRTTPGRTRTHPASPWRPNELTLVLRTQNGVTKSSTTTKGTPEPEPEREEDYSQLQTPATGTSSSHAHTQLRIARTKRNDFTVFSPPNLRCQDLHQTTITVAYHGKNCT